MPVDLEQLGRAIKQLQYRNHRAMETGLLEVGTTVAQWDALRAIANNPAASAHKLALATFQSDQSFGALATRLIALGLVERSPGQGRRLEHRLTANGERMLAAGYPKYREAVETVFGALSESERETLHSLVSALVTP